MVRSWNGFSINPSAGHEGKRKDKGTCGKFLYGGTSSVLFVAILVSFLMISVSVSGAGEQTSNPDTAASSSDKTSVIVAQIQYISGKTGQSVMSLEFRPPDYLLLRGMDGEVQNKENLPPDKAKPIRRLVQDPAILNELITDCEQPTPTDYPSRTVRLVTQYKTVIYKLKPGCHPPVLQHELIERMESLRVFDSEKLQRYQNLKLLSSSTGEG